MKDESGYLSMTVEAYPSYQKLLKISDLRDAQVTAK